METEKLALTTLFFTLCLGLAVCFSTGPPAEESTCVNMRPGSRAPHILQPGNGTYDLTVDAIGEANDDGYFPYSASTSYTGECRVIFRNK